MPQKFVMTLAFLLLSGQLLWAEELSRADKFLIGVKESIDGGDQVKTDFWIARYLGELAIDKNTGRTLQDLTPFLGRHPAARAKWALPNYHESFNNWFLDRSQSQWGVPDERVYNDSFEMINGDDGKSGTGETYFAAIFAIPTVEGWNIGGREGVQPMVLGSMERKPNILSGKLIPGEKVEYYHTVPLEIEGPMQNVWKPEFEDLDDDGIPELFIRYNYTVPNGFDQGLAVYRFVNGEPVLLHKFIGNYGGFARKIGNKQVEVGSGSGPGGAIAVVTWGYSGSSFISISQESIANIYDSEDWRQYY